MIKQKKCKCGCDKYPTIGFRGYNYRCAPEDIRAAKFSKIRDQREKSKERQRVKGKVRRLIPLQDSEAVERQVRLNKWFEYVATVIAANPHCWNCGSPISKADYRNSTGHIFPKGIFHSVETHPLNFVVVGNRCGCHNLTHRIDTFSKMMVWKKAKASFLQFEKDITEHHKYLNLFRAAAGVKEVGVTGNE